MLNAKEVNIILESLIQCLEERAPALKPIAVEAPQGVTSQGTYGSVILGALLTGHLDGKITLTLEWTTALQIVEELTHTKLDTFNEGAQRALEGVFYETAQAIAAGLVAAGREVEIYPLPTLVDTSALLAEEGGVRTVRIGMFTKNAGTINLYLAFGTTEVAAYGPEASGLPGAA